jgi:hypothetical protein
MKTPIKKSINCLRLISLVLLTAIIWITGCSAPKPTPDPLAGWKVYFHEPNQLITGDYKDYIQKLPTEERKYAGMIQYFKDGEGKIAVKIEVGVNGTWWDHVLIYDKENKRIKVIKYVSGYYRS